MDEIRRPPGRPRTPEDELDERERRKRERWRAYAAARYEAQRPQREAQRLAREALKAEKPAARRRKASTAKPCRDRKAASQRPQGIPAGDTRPW